VTRRQPLAFRLFAGKEFFLMARLRCSNLSVINACLNSILFYVEMCHQLQMCGVATPRNPNLVLSYAVSFVHNIYIMFKTVLSE
jgi:hypothetical protein